MHKKSNHPPSILKNIPDSINKRLSEISSDRHCFDNAKTVYQEALNKSGYNYNLSYNEPRNEIQHSRKNRPRNILWYNPPFDKESDDFVYKHFHGPGHHGLRDVSVQIIDKVHNNEKLFMKEGEWAYRLQTLKPEGLNDSDFFYSQNRVTRNR